VQVRLLQTPEDVLRRGRWGQRIDRPGDPHREHPPRMPRLTQGGVIERQIAGQRVDSRGEARPNPGKRLLHFVDQGFHVAGITRMAHGQMPGKDNARGGLGNHVWLAAELSGAMTLPFADGRNRGIVGIGDLAMGQRLALRQPAGLACDPVMRLERDRELGVQTPLLRFRQLRYAGAGILGRPALAAGPALPAPTMASPSGALVSQTRCSSPDTDGRNGASPAGGRPEVAVLAPSTVPLVAHSLEARSTAG
jgi:hypothetical protein